MLPKNKRLTKELFTEIIKTGRTISSPIFSFRYLSKMGPEDKNTQYAFVVPKSVSKSAIQRNKLRRQGYNHLRTYPSLPPLLGIFFYKKEVKTATNDEIKKNIKFILDKLN